MSDSESEQEIQEAAQELPQESVAIGAGAGGVRMGPQLSALRHRDYRLFFSGQIISLTGTWLQSVAQSWLITQLAPPSQRALMVGLVSAVSAFPILLLSLFAGIVADRFPKRSILVATQSVMMVLAFLLAALTYWDTINIASVMVIGFLLGTANALDAPARHAFVIDMVGREDLENAIATNSAMFNGARIVGPAVAGLVVAIVGLAGAFLLNGLSFVAVIIGLRMMTVTGRPTAQPASQWQSLKEGLAFVRGNRMVASLLVLAGSVSVFAAPYATMMPVFARDVLHVGVKELGYLMASTGAGALLGAITLSSLGWVRRKGRVLLAGNIVFWTMMVAFSFTRHMLPAMALLLGVGWGMIANTALTNTLIQVSVPNHLRGRVMSLYVVMFLGMMPIGSLLWGLMAHYIGVPAMIRIGAITCGAFALALSRNFVGVVVGDD